MTQMPSTASIAVNGWILSFDLLEIKDIPADISEQLVHQRGWITSTAS